MLNLTGCFGSKKKTSFIVIFGALLIGGIVLNIYTAFDKSLFPHITGVIRYLRANNSTRLIENPADVSSNTTKTVKPTTTQRVRGSSKPVSKTKHIARQSTVPISKIEPTTTTSTTTISSTELPTTANPYSCPFPNPDPLDPQIKKYVRNYPPLDCSKKRPSFVYLDGDFLRVNKTKIDLVGKKWDVCRYTPLLLSKKDDSHLQDPTWSKNFTESIRLPKTVEHLFVECLNKNNIVAETYIARFVENQKAEKRAKELYKIHVEKNSPAETLSILFVGMDGMSKQNFIRTMPKTKDYIVNQFNAKEMNKFNKVGDNTFHNIIVLLSGHTHTGLSKFNSFCFKRDYFDKIDDIFLWHAFKNAGYRAATFFDTTRGTAFHYLKEGWKNPPFDYYLRPLTLKADDHSKDSRAENCIGETAEVTLLLDYWLQLTANYNNTKTRPYFAYSFFTYLSHDYQNDASKGDEMYLKFFKKLKAQNVLNNTLLIFFSDHGPRFGAMRHTYYGKIEALSPFMFFMFPPWFEEKYPKETAAFHINQNRLATNFDVHATLLDLLHFRSKNKIDRKTPGQSLFTEIPSERNCKDAHIPMEYCACKELIKTKIPSSTASRLSQIVLEMVLKRTEKNRNICAFLSLKEIISVNQLKSPSASEGLYHITIQTTPGNAIFEALLKYGTKKSTLVGDIIRLNLYRGQDMCVNTLALKPYCYCKV